MVGADRRAITVETLRRRAVEAEPVEIVERKGRGHPDSICDGVMESVCLDLAAEYLARTGQTAHFNVDKALLVAGESTPRFGGGRIVRPMRLILAGRAAREIGGLAIPVDEIAARAADRYLRETLRLIDPARDCHIECAIGPGSESLGEIYRREAVVANDTSIGVGYAPLSETERAVLDVERLLNSADFKHAHPETGEDVKVMAIRRGRALHVTIALAFVDRFIGSEASYFQRKREVTDTVRERLGDTLHECEVDGIEVNALDTAGRGESGLYLTVHGTSAENGDDGQVGRGNQVNGLITVNRPRGPEAAPGKNPVNHVGKVYSVLAGEIANAVYRDVSGLREVYVRLVSQIGAPIDHPLIAWVQVLPERGVVGGRLHSRVRTVVDGRLADVPALSERLLRGEFPMW